MSIEYQYYNKYHNKKTLSHNKVLNLQVSSNITQYKKQYKKDTKQNNNVLRSWGISFFLSSRSHESVNNNFMAMVMFTS